MNGTSRILLVDDDPTVRGLYSQVLRAEGYEVWEVSTGQQGLEAVRERRPDLVLLDVELPDLSGVEVCRRIKTDKALENVFVVLFSAHDPDAARKTYGREFGADDYIVKTGKLDEFLARIQTAVRFRDATAALRTSLTHYTLLAEHIREVFWLTDAAKREMIYISPAYEQIWGRTCESLYASPRDWVEAIHPEDRQRVLEAALAKQVSGEYDEVYRILRPDGALRWIQDRAFPIRNEAGEVCRILGIAEDITERRSAETNYQNIFENANEGIFQTTPDGRYLKANPAQARMLGYASPEELTASISDLGRQLCVQPESRIELKRRIETNGYVREFEHEVYCKEGNKKWLSINARVVRDDRGAILYYEGNSQDITGRKQAEQQIRLLADAVQSAQERISVTDTQNRFTFVNRAFLEAYGYGEEEVLGRKPDILYSPNNPPGLCEQVYQQTLSGGWMGEILCRRKDGSEFPSSLSTSQIKDGEGKVVGLVGVARDISERRRTEKQRVALAQLGYKLSAAATPEAAAHSMLEVASELFGWDAGYMELYSSGDDRIIPILTFDTIDGQRRPVPSPQVDPTPLMRWVMQKGGVLLDQEDETPVNLVPFGNTSRSSASKMFVPIHSKGEVLGILSIQSYTPGAYSRQDLGLLQVLADLCGDALQRIRVADALREAEAKYRTIFENATEGIFQTTPEGRHLKANPALARMLGYQSPEELLSHVTDIEGQTYVTPERRREFKRQMEMHGSVQGFEAERYRKDGSRIWLSINSHIVRDANGVILYYEGTNQDITERKRNQQRLADALELNLTILSASSVGIVAYKASGQCIFANGAAARIVGASPEQLLQQNFRLLSSWQKGGLLKMAEAALRTRKMQSRNVHLVTSFGKEVWMECQMASFVSGGELHLLVLDNEITARKRVEQALEQSRRLQKAILENISDPAWLKDVEGHFLACNGALAKFYGLTPKKLIGKTVFDLGIPDAAQLAVEDKQVMRSRKAALFEAGRTDAQGRGRWFESFKSPIFDEQGSITGIVGIARDVTERKRTEGELRELSQRVIEAQEVERLRVARELHDGVNQIIASAKMRLCKVEEAVSAAGPAAREILARCDHLLVRALEENRRIAHDLRPSDLDQLGLAAACRNFCNELQTRTKLTLKCQITKFSQRLPSPVELNLFRIVQEALNNVEKHAKAKTARLRLSVQGDFLVLKIQDDGIGFVPGRARRNKMKRRGIGLTNMRERAVALGGTCEIVAASCQGTKITVRIPFQQSSKKATRPALFQPPAASTQQTA